MPAPISFSVVSRPVRSGLVITPSRMISEPGTISAATSGNAADDGSAGTTTGAASSSGWPFSVMRRPCSPNSSDADLGAEMLEHLLGVVAGRLFLDHGRGARRGEARQQHRRLELRRRHRRPRTRSGSDRARPAASAAAGRLRACSTVRAPIFSSGSRMRRIGRVRRLASPSKVDLDRAAGHRAHRQPAAGAGIAEIERRPRLRKAADARPP